MISIFEIISTQISRIFGFSKKKNYFNTFFELHTINFKKNPENRWKMCERPLRDPRVALCRFAVVGCEFIGRKAGHTLTFTCASAKVLGRSTGPSGSAILRSIWV